MTLAEQNALANDPEFRGRIRMAALQYAVYVLGAPRPMPGQMALLTWAQKTMQSPDAAAQLLQPNVVIDANVQSAGAQISDEALQGAVETTVARMI